MSAIGTFGRILGKSALKGLEWGAHGVAWAAKAYTDEAWQALGGRGSPLGSLGRSMANRLSVDEMAQRPAATGGTFDAQKLEAIRVRMSSIDDKMTMNNSLMSQILDLVENGGLSQGEESTGPQSSLKRALGTLVGIFGAVAVGAAMGYLLKTTDEQKEDEKPVDETTDTKQLEPPVEQPTPLIKQETVVPPPARKVSQIANEPQMQPVAFKQPKQSNDDILEFDSIEFIAKNITFAADNLKLGEQAVSTTRNALGGTVSSMSNIKPVAARTSAASGGLPAQMPAMSTQPTFGKSASTLSSGGASALGGMGDLISGGGATPTASAPEGASVGNTDGDGADHGRDQSSSAPAQSSSSSAPTDSTQQAAPASQSSSPMEAPDDGSAPAAQAPAAAQSAPAAASTPMEAPDDGSVPPSESAAPAAAQSSTTAARPTDSASPSTVAARLTDTVQSNPATPPIASAPATPVAKPKPQSLQIEPGSTLDGYVNKKTGRIEVPWGFGSMVPSSIPREKDGSIDPKKVRPDMIPAEYRDKIKDYGGRFSENTATPPIVDQSSRYALNNDLEQTSAGELYDQNAPIPTNNENPNPTQVADATPSARTTTDRDLAYNAHQSSEFGGGVAT